MEHKHFNFPNKYLKKLTVNLYVCLLLLKNHTIKNIESKQMKESFLLIFKTRSSIYVYERKNKDCV